MRGTFVGGDWAQADAHTVMLYYYNTSEHSWQTVNESLTKPQHYLTIISPKRKSVLAKVKLPLIDTPYTHVQHLVLSKMCRIRVRKYTQCNCIESYRDFPCELFEHGRGLRTCPRFQWTMAATRTQGMCRRHWQAALRRDEGY